MIKCEQVYDLGLYLDKLSYELIETDQVSIKQETYLISSNRCN